MEEVKFVAKTFEEMLLKENDKNINTTVFENTDLLYQMLEFGAHITKLNGEYKIYCALGLQNKIKGYKKDQSSGTLYKVYNKSSGLLKRCVGKCRVYSLNSLPGYNKLNTNKKASAKKNSLAIASILLIPH